MDTEQMIYELRYLEEKHKNDKHNTFETNWHLLCHDVANRLEELNNELNSKHLTKADFNGVLSDL